MGQIRLTRTSGQQFRVDTRQIESVEADPDVRVLLLTGETVIMRESVEDIVATIVESRRRRIFGLPLNKGRTGLS